MSKYQALIDALKVGPTSALFTHPRDCNAWKENEQFALACQPDTIRSLLADLERAEKDAERYRWLRAEHERHDPVCHLSWKQNSDRDGSEWVNTANLDAAIDAALSQLKGVQ